MLFYINKFFSSRGQTRKEIYKERNGQRKRLYGRNRKKTTRIVQEEQQNEENRCPKSIVHETGRQIDPKQDGDDVQKFTT